MNEKESDRLKRENRLLRYEVREAMILLGKTAGPASMYGPNAREDWKDRYAQLVCLYGPLAEEETP